MANKRCKTCKHWEDHYCGNFDANGLGPFAQICVDADNVYVVKLETHPEFGCACWEGKTK